MEEQDFEKFWATYPKKRSKGDAFKAWGQVRARRPAIDRMLKALAVLKASDDWRRDGGQYIPYPASWLRAWGWEDVPEVQINDVRDGKVWWQSVSGIDAKAAELGIDPWKGDYAGLPETYQQYTKRVRAAAESNVVPLKRIA